MIQTQLYPDSVIDFFSTQSIKYIGSKIKIIPYILDLLKYTNGKTILDGFAGSTRVSQALAKSNYNVICNDIAVYTEVFGKCYLQSNKPKKYYQKIINHLNSLLPIEGWFSENYGGYDNDGSAVQSDGKKALWQMHNARKLDAIRQEIEDLNLNSIDKSVAITSLILALDKVDNTIGHFSSYLKNWSPRSYKKLYLEVPNIFPKTQKHEVYRSDIFDIISDKEFDIVYYDPPYGSNNKKMPASRVRYNAYYHIWTSICLFDKPNLFGKASRRADSRDKISASVFEEFKKSIYFDNINKLLKSTNSQYIILSYSSGGNEIVDELYDIINDNGKLIKVVKIPYKKNVMSEMKWTKEWVKDAENGNCEYLFLVGKNG